MSIATFQYVQSIFTRLCFIVYLSLGDGPIITTNNTEILITNIGGGGQPPLTCHTDSYTCCRRADNYIHDIGGLGRWTWPNGSVILNNASSIAAGQQFYIVRNAAQLIRLARREGNNPLSPTGSYCCTVPTTEGNMILCANLGE